MNEDKFVFRATCEHGKIRAMAVDEPDIMKDIDLSDWVRRGCTVDRVTAEVARASDMHCEPCDEKRANKVAQNMNVWAS